MPAKFKKGEQVRQIVEPITGTIVKPEIIDDEIQYLVEFTHNDGEVHQRYFKEDQIEIQG